LDVDPVSAVHQNVRNVRIGEERFERTESEQFVQDVGNDALALIETQRNRLRLAIEHSDNETANLRLGVLPADLRQPFEVQSIQEVVVNPTLQVLILRMPNIDTARGSSRRSHQ